MKTKFKANISITTVLVITTTLLLSAMAVLLNTMDLSTGTKASNNKIINELNAQSCVEEGLYRLKYNTSFLGEVSIPFTNGNCTNSITIDPTNPNVRVFTINSTNYSYEYNVIKHVNISQIPFMIID